MKRVYAYILLLSALSGGLYAANKQGAWDFQADRIRIDSVTNEVHAESASFSTFKGRLIKADKATFKKDGARIPHAIEMENVEFAVSSDALGMADKATYYPEFSALVSDRLVIRTLSGDLDYRCSNGTLYDHGTPVPNNSVCTNDPGGGSTTIGCGASGNSVKMTLSPESCPVGPEE